MNDEPVRLPGWRDEAWRHKYTVRGKVRLLKQRIAMRTRPGRVILFGMLIGLLMGAATAVVILGGG
jgi:hypothetical protein